MDIRDGAPIAAEVVRYHLRPMRRALGRAVRRESRSLWGATTGPRRISGHTVVLRSPRLRDAEQWRAVRLREQTRMEPVWATSDLSWDQRHSVEAWVSTTLMVRGLARSGRALPFVVEVDGRFAGEVVFTAVDRAHGTAEAGTWFDPRLVRSGIFDLAPAMAFDHVFDVVGLRRISAPIATTNVAAARTARRLGFTHEARLADHMDVGGAPQDHDLFVLTADSRPPGGLADLAGRRRGAAARPGVVTAP